MSSINQFILSIFDLSKSPSLPQRWAQEIIEAATNLGTLVHLNGDSPDSREPNTGHGAYYYVIPGDLIATQLPWLSELYENYFLQIASIAAGKNLGISKSIKLGLNINILRGACSGYEWHVDPCPISAVLFVTTHPKEEGGELSLKIEDSAIEISPKTGMIVVFDGQIPHGVLPLKKETLRISIPMVFYASGEEQGSTSEIEEYLYTPTKEKDDRHG